MFHTIGAEKQGEIQTSVKPKCFRSTASPLYSLNEILIDHKDWNMADHQNYML